MVSINMYGPQCHRCLGSKQLLQGTTIVIPTAPQSTEMIDVVACAYVKIIVPLWSTVVKLDLLISRSVLHFPPHDGPLRMHSTKASGVHASIAGLNDRPGDRQFVSIATEEMRASLLVRAIFVVIVFIPPPQKLEIPPISPDERKEVTIDMRWAF